MAKRKIIKIDEAKCNGCGLCIPNCPEGAIQIIDQKARLISDLFCDGLGACIGHCPEGAITIEEREATPYDEGKVMDNIAKQGKNVIMAHLRHLKEHNEEKLLKEAISYLKDRNIDISFEGEQEHMEPKHSEGCPGLKIMDLRGKESPKETKKSSVNAESQLNNWPIQIKLVPVHAPYLDRADLLIAADCVSFSYANFHDGLLKGKVLLIGCPKLDDSKLYLEKITQIFKNNNITSVTCLHMEVPCCFGLVNIIESALAACGKKIPLKKITISVKGQILK